MALSVVDRIRKRAFYPLTLVNGEKVHLRGLTENQLKIVREMNGKDASAGYAIGVSLLEDDGQRVFVEEDAESPEQFGSRVLESIESGDNGIDVQKQIVAKIFEITNEPDKVKAEAIIKNC